MKCYTHNEKIVVAKVSAYTTRPSRPIVHAGGAVNVSASFPTLHPMAMK